MTLPPLTMDPAAELVGAASLLHRRVVDPRGRELGRIEDLMLDAEGGAVAYAVVAVGARAPAGSRVGAGGGSGRGEIKRFSLPWHLLRVLPAGGGIVADLNRDALAQSPGMSPRGAGGPLTRSSPPGGSSPAPPRRLGWP